MAQSVITNIVPRGIKRGHRIHVDTSKNNGLAIQIALCAEVNRLFGQGFFMRKATPDSITRAHDIAIAIVPDVGIGYKFRKGKDGQITYSPFFCTYPDGSKNPKYAKYF
jgi:hypothetical protein